MNRLAGIFVRLVASISKVNRSATSGSVAGGEPETSATQRLSAEAGALSAGSGSVLPPARPTGECSGFRAASALQAPRTSDLPRAGDFTGLHDRITRLSLDRALCLTKADAPDYGNERTRASLAHVAACIIALDETEGAKQELWTAMRKRLLSRHVSEDGEGPLALRLARLSVWEAAALTDDDDEDFGGSRTRGDLSRLAKKMICEADSCETSADDLWSDFKTRALKSLAERHTAHRVVSWSLH